MVYDSETSAAHWSLDHVWSLCAEVFHGVEDVNESLTLHPLYGSTQGTEGTRSTYSSTAQRQSENFCCNRKGIHNVFFSGS